MRPVLLEVVQLRIEMLPLLEYLLRFLLLAMKSYGLLKAFVGILLQYLTEVVFVMDFRSLYELHCCRVTLKLKQIRVFLLSYMTFHL